MEYISPILYLKKRNQTLNKAFFISVVLLGLTLTIFHLISCARQDKLLSQEKLVNIMLLSTGVLSGFCLMIGTIFEDFNKLLGNNLLYVFLSGLAILVASVNPLQKDILSEFFSKKAAYTRCSS